MIKFTALAGIAAGVLSMGIGMVSGWTAPCEAATVARLSPSGDAIELEYQMEGTTARSTIPVYRSGQTRYFAAGVGLEEREAAYPPFPLKLIFVAGGRPYLSQVAVSIADPNGAEVLRVPAEQVTGPWLFVELPAGNYRVTASQRDGTAVTQEVQVPKDGTKVVQLRWPGAP
jgi:hypothetical protein